MSTHTVFNPAKLTSEQLAMLTVGLYYAIGTTGGLRLTGKLTGKCEDFLSLKHEGKSSPIFILARACDTVEPLSANDPLLARIQGQGQVQNKKGDQ